MTSDRELNDQLRRCLLNVLGAKDLDEDYQADVAAKFVFLIERTNDDGCTPAWKDYPGGPAPFVDVGRNGTRGTGEGEDES